jgi:hypothetical protein
MGEMLYIKLSFLDVLLFDKFIPFLLPCQNSLESVMRHCDNYQQKYRMLFCLIISSKMGLLTESDLPCIL